MAVRLTSEKDELAATRDALARLREDGADLGKAHSIDFHVAVPSEQSGRLVSEQAMFRGFRTELVQDQPGVWTVWCTKVLVPSESAISEIEAQLNELAAPYDGYSDGWGAFPVA